MQLSAQHLPRFSPPAPLTQCPTEEQDAQEDAGGAHGWTQGSGVWENVICTLRSRELEQLSKTGRDQ